MTSFWPEPSRIESKPTWCDPFLGLSVCCEAWQNQLDWRCGLSFHTWHGRSFHSNMTHLLLSLYRSSLGSCFTPWLKVMADISFNMVKVCSLHRTSWIWIRFVVIANNIIVALKRQYGYGMCLIYNHTNTSNAAKPYIK